MNYFTNVFHSDKLTNHPRIDDVTHNRINDYIISNGNSMTPFSMFELELALARPGKGNGIDGLPPDILKFFPPPLIEILLKLFNQILYEDYPDSWRQHLLLAIPKKGHSFAFSRHSVQLKELLRCLLFPHVIHSVGIF